MSSEEQIECPECDGTGKILSHNPRCTTCNGSGYISKEQSAKIFYEQQQAYIRGQLRDKMQRAMYRMSDEQLEKTVAFIESMNTQ